MPLPPSRLLRCRAHDQAYIYHSAPPLHCFQCTPVRKEKTVRALVCICSLDWMSHKARLAHKEAKNTIQLGADMTSHIINTVTMNIPMSTDTNDKMKGKYNTFIIRLAANIPVRLTFCIYVLTRVAFASDPSWHICSHSNRSRSSGHHSRSIAIATSYTPSPLLSA